MLTSLAIVFASVFADPHQLSRIAAARAQHSTTVDAGPDTTLRSVRFLIPTRLARKGCCAEGDSLAHSWVQPIIGVQRDAPDKAHPHFNPQIVWRGPWTAPGAWVQAWLPRYNEGDTFVARLRNLAPVDSLGCWWGVSFDSTNTCWKPLEAW